MCARLSGPVWTTIGCGQRGADLLPLAMQVAADASRLERILVIDGDAAGQSAAPENRG